MHTHMRMVIGIVGVLAIVAIGLPALWHQPDVSGTSGLPEAQAGGDEMKDAIQEHLDIASQHDKDAERREAEAQRYEKKGSAITPTMDPKGFRRAGLKMAADSHSSMASEFRYRAKVHRLEAELLTEKAKYAAKEN